MTFTVSPWLVWAGTSLALFGVWFVCEKTGAWLGRVRDWWRDRRDARESGVPVSGFRRLREWAQRDRVTPLLEDDLGGYEDDPAPVDGWGCYPSCPPDCMRHKLPPERTWEQMTSHQLPLVGAVMPSTHYLDGRRRGFTYGAGTGREPMPLPGEPQYLAAARERRPPEYEAEARAHYVAMGFEYPSGLMARVREAAP